ncbi:MAG: 50S ribosomal protein L17 [Candidatus Jorgensenbacteria bacterium]|nr:50S ribosomal protein L17 [Candidatus Jorgensenbacteria bacterium]
MRHQNKGRKFGRERGQRKAFLRNLAGQLITRERITTTEARAKELRTVVERFVTYGKRQNLASLRLLIQKLPKAAAYKVYHELGTRYASRAGGYTRIVKRAQARKSDGAHMAVIEFV